MEKWFKTWFWFYLISDGETFYGEYNYRHILMKIDVLNEGQMY